MSTFMIKPAVAPSLGMLASGHAFIATPCTGTWRTDVATPILALADAADRSYAFAKAGVAFEAKRRNAKGSPAWRPTDC